MGCGTSRTVRSPAEPAATVTASVSTQQSGVSKGGSVRKPATTLVKAWVGTSDGLAFPEVDDPDFALPALADKAPLAICISGGGFRAATLALGWLRGLYVLGVLQKARYLVTCSGSAWVSAALSFQQVTDPGEFLGPYLPPEQCSLEALKQVGAKGRSCAAALADASPVYDIAKDLLGLKFDGADDSVKARTWTKAMTAAFLEPFGLADTNTSTTTCSGTQGSVHESVASRGAAVGRGTVYSASVRQLPYPIICQCLMLPKDRLLHYPFEWTPLYGGCPVSYDNTEPRLGCGWVEALGLNAELVEKPLPAAAASGAGDGSCLTGVCHTVTVRPAGPASLGEAMGVSSAYNSYRWALGKSEGGKELHKALGFNTAAYFDQQDWRSSTVALTDGGAVDYHAVYPALRRRVPNILVLSASRTRVEGFDQFAKWMKDLAALFGCWPGDPADKTGLPAEELNRQRQVFPVGGFAELHAGLVARTQAGGPPVHVGEYEVVANAALGIPGGWRVRVMWVVNDVQPGWEAALPEDTRRQLEGDRRGFTAKVVEALNPLDADTLRMFPHVSTFAMNYPPELVGLMANHAAHMVVAAREQLESLVAGGLG